MQMRHWRPVQNLITNNMERNELWGIIERMKDYMSSEQILDALCMSLNSDTLEEHLRYIDRNYETHLFN